MIIRKRTTLVPSVHVDLGEAEVDLRYDFNARAALLEVLTPSDFARFADAAKATEPEQMAAKFPLASIIKFVWAGTQHEEDAPTLKELGGWIHESKLAEILAAAMDAMEKHGFVPKPDAGGETAKAENPTQTPEHGETTSANSGPSLVTTAVSRRKSSGR